MRGLWGTDLGEDLDVVGTGSCKPIRDHFAYRVVVNRPMLSPLLESFIISF